MLGSAVAIDLGEGGTAKADPSSSAAADSLGMTAREWCGVSGAGRANSADYARWCVNSRQLKATSVTTR